MTGHNTAVQWYEKHLDRMQFSLVGFFFSCIAFGCLLTLANSLKEIWKSEMEGGRTVLEKFANIPKGVILGSRAPLLRVGGNRQFKVGLKLYCRHVKKIWGEKQVMKVKKIWGEKRIMKVHNLRPQIVILITQLLGTKI